VFNVGSTEEVSIEALALRTVALARSSSEIVFVPYDEAYEVGFEDMRRRVPDITKIRSLIGWEPRVDLDGILGSVIAYEREHGRV
jgi:UDP-glucose 4-epimerase